MVKTLLLITVALYTLVSSSGCTHLIRSYKSDKLLERWEALTNSRRHNEAEAVLREAIKNNPANVKLWIALGDTYFTIENYRSATYAYLEALRLDRNAFDANTGLWRVLLEESGYTEESKKEVKKEVRYFIDSPDRSPDSLMAAFHGLILLHEYDTAYKIIEEIIAAKPAEEVIATLSGFAFEEILREKDVDKRLRMIEYFLSVFPSSKERHMVHNIRMRIASKDIEDKEIFFQYGEEWLREKPDNRRANFAVAYWYTADNIALEKAVLYIQKALSLIDNPDLGDKPEHYPVSEWHKDLQWTKGIYYSTLGWAYYQLGKDAEADGAYRKAVGYLDFSEGLYYRMGLLSEDKGDIENAIKSYVRALKSGENEEASERLSIIAPAHFGIEPPLYKYFAHIEGITTFTDITEQAGLSGFNGNRLAWSDYNNDGHEDILINGARLVRNNGNGTFTDVTDDAGIITGIRGARGGLWGDVDNDGYIDFYTFSSGKGSMDSLWRNNRDGTFADMTTAAIEVPDIYPTEAAAWGDYDNDGLIDLYVANYEKHLREAVARARGNPDRLFHNNGNGTFTEMSSAAGVVSLEKMCGRGVSWGDYNNDGNIDIYVTNYRLDPNFLWRNNGDGTFTNVASDVGVEGNEVEGAYGHSIGAEWGDYDNDGDLDLFVSNLAHPRYIGFSDKSMLLENQGPPDYKFINRFGESGIRFEETSADPSFVDYDSDGFLDLYFSSTYSGRKSFLYKGAGNGTFTDVTWLAGVRVDNAWGNVFADFDSDGDSDLLVGSGNGIRLFRNDGNNNHWLHVQVLGIESNSAGIGTRVTVVPGDPHSSPPLSRQAGGENIGGQMREVQGGKGSGSQHSLPVEFGLGDYGGPVDIEVRFPSGRIIRKARVDTDQMLIIKESDQVPDNSSR